MAVDVVDSPVAPMRPSDDEDQKTAKTIPMPVRQTPLYENCSVFSPEGTLMFRCSRKKIDWYLSRNLAVPMKEGDDEQVDPSAPHAIQLTFTPRGNGRNSAGEEYYLEERQNICVGCGFTDGLTSHHIVPYQYRKFMPDSLKSHASHDVVLLCVNCHDAYELHAVKLKKTIAKKYNIPLEGRGHIVYHEHRKVHSAANAILHSRRTQHPDKNRIPEQRLQELHAILRDFFTFPSDHPISSADLEAALELPQYGRAPDFVEHGEVVVGCMSEKELETFIRDWRRHFQTYARPGFLSEAWRVENPVRNR
ncbi:uncharacterized protein EV422DRAFT_348519 [Fimicolochytrium jonesii]|uniref:uncharacterized protein n=1 Tax=Fimicolochytrium jonesii TaxID=1396493 RepID=UPI0022FDEA4D|nr:uncharacterized protein EV422DRAFT_348519 [Fimicolochytrium jonesii]KAI8815675.1 hypothetical protein EV422DRAFT_348519 [Fimicolochytrium jonesii]